MSWRDIAYKSIQGLLWDDEEKATNDAVAEAFRERLHKVAGFKTVASPLPMRNSTAATVYYLLFASHPNRWR